MAQVLNRIVRLLHPFAPFITEEIYQKLPLRSEALIVATYPTPKSEKEWFSLGVEKSAQDLDLVKDVISALRNIRGENRIKPSLKITCRLAVTDAETQKVLSHNRVYITSLAGLSSLDIGEPGSLSKCALSPVHSRGRSVDVIVPLEGLVDIDEEIKRLQKGIDKLTKDVQSLEARLANQNFVKNAPAEVVEDGRRQAESLRQQIATMNSGLARLRN
jgi:valyl-tRNA synthetase